MKLRPYQQKTLDNMIKELSNGAGSILVNLPTGAGKTILATEFIRLCLEWDKRVIFCVDREELIMQTYNKFKQVTSDLSILKAGLEGMFNPLARVQIIGLQTYHARQPEMDCDVLIIDEVHQGYGASMQTGLIKSMDGARLIGLSASPITERGDLLPNFDSYIADVQTADLIKLGYLANPIVYQPESCAVDLTKIGLVGNDYNSKEIDEIVIDLKKVEAIVDEWERIASKCKTLVFANSIAHAEMIYAEFVKRGYADIDVIHSKTDDLKSKRNKLKYKQIIINCGILTTGYDDPDIECVLLARPTAILRLYLQIVGRGLRVTETKKECIILDCANCVSKHGLPQDYRFYTPRKPKNDEPLFRGCPECGNVEPIHILECSICGYDFRLIDDEPKGTGSKVSKKELDRLVKVYSLQEKLYNEIKDLIKERGYKPGMAWHLFRNMLKKKSNNLSMLQFYKTRLTKVEKIRKNNWKLQSIVYK